MYLLLIQMLARITSVTEPLQEAYFTVCFFRAPNTADTQTAFYLVPAKREEAQGSASDQNHEYFNTTNNLPQHIVHHKANGNLNNVKLNSSAEKAAAYWEVLLCECQSC